MENAIALRILEPPLEVVGESRCAIERHAQAVIVFPEVGVLDQLPPVCAWIKPPDPEAVIHKALDMMACKAAVKAGDELAPAERQVLIQQRHLVDKGSNCPHGRPTALRCTLAELERQFKRR